MKRKQQYLSETAILIKQSESRLPSVHGCVKKMDHADPELEGALNQFIIEFEDRLTEYV